MTELLFVEVRRNLSRRLVWVLVGLAVLATVVAGVIVFITTDSPGSKPAEPYPGYQANLTSCVEQRVAAQPQVARSTAEAQCVQMLRPAERNGFEFVDLWPKGGTGDPALGFLGALLAIGGLLGGASMVGAEWRAGTMTTLLTWEPRRVRVAVAKLAAAGVLALLIAFALLTFFVVVFWLVSLARDVADGVDGEWLRGLVGGMLRISTVAGFAAVIGAAVSMIGRNTAAALGLAYGYMLVGENFIRVLRPGLGRWLVGENGSIFITGRSSAALFERGPATAGLTLAFYAAVLGALGVLSLRNRDVAST